MPFNATVIRFLITFCVSIAFCRSVILITEKPMASFAYLMESQYVECGRNERRTMRKMEQILLMCVLCINPFCLFFFLYVHCAPVQSTIFACASASF